MKIILPPRSLFLFLAPGFERHANPVGIVNFVKLLCFVSLKCIM